MTNNATKTYHVAVIERALAYYVVEAENARTAAENWQDGEFEDRDDEALDTEGPSSVRERQPDGSWLTIPPSEWETTDPDLPSRFDDYEIHGVREFDQGHGKYFEQVPDDEARFWSLFGHIPDKGVECIGDFETRKLAEQIYARITGRRYGSPS